MDSSAALDPTVTIILAVLTLLGVTVAPIAVALINRGGKATATDPTSDEAISRRDYDQLLEQLARLDDECDRLTRENNRLRRRS